MVLLLLACNVVPESTVSMAEGCDGWMGAATSDQVLATPRHDPEAEKLAVCMSGDVVATEVIYRRVQADLAEIHELEPRTREQIPRLEGDGNQLEVVLEDTEARDDAESGTGDWSCPTDHYGAAVTGAGFDAVLVRLDGVFDLELVLGDWAEIAGVASVRPTVGLPDGPRVVGGIDADVFHYVFDDRQGCESGACTYGAATHWTSTPDGHVRLIDATTWEGDAPTPVWYADYGACQG